MIAMDNAFKKLAIAKLEPLLTEKRQAKLARILKDRMTYMSVVLEDIYNPQNSNAVLRSCDCFGIQDVHIIENINPHEQRNEVSKGSDKWLSLHYYKEEGINNSIECIKALKDKGIRVVATKATEDAVALRDFDVRKGPFALVLGNELHGITEEMDSLADEYIHIPMYGFTQSFNLSVAGALCIHHLRHELDQQAINWKLSPDEEVDVHLRWIINTLPNGDFMLKRMFQDYQESIIK